MWVLTSSAAILDLEGGIKRHDIYCSNSDSLNIIRVICAIFFIVVPIAIGLESTHFSLMFPHNRHPSLAHFSSLFKASPG